MLEKLKHKFLNIYSYITTGKTIDEYWAEDRIRFEKELIENYRKKCGTNNLPFDLNKLSMKGVIDFKHALERDNFDVERAMRDINYGVYELIVSKFDETMDQFGCRKYYEKIK